MLIEILQLHHIKNIILILFRSTIDATVPCPLLTMRFQKMTCYVWSLFRNAFSISHSMNRLGHVFHISIIQASNTDTSISCQINGMVSS